MPFFPFLQLFTADAEIRIWDHSCLVVPGSCRSFRTEIRKEKPGPFGWGDFSVRCPSLSIRWSLLPSPAAAGNSQDFSEITPKAADGEVFKSRWDGEGILGVGKTEAEKGRCSWQLFEYSKGQNNDNYNNAKTIITITLIVVIIIIKIIRTMVIN